MSPFDKNKPKRNDENAKQQQGFRQDVVSRDKSFLEMDHTLLFVQYKFSANVMLLHRPIMCILRFGEWTASVVAFTDVLQYCIDSVA